MPKKVIIANQSHSELIENLRYASYCNSDAFIVSNHKEVEAYCKWSEKDDNGIVLLALNENAEPLSTLRANIYFHQAELEENSPIFKNNSNNFIQYPVLNMAIAATNPKYLGIGALSVLRYYMYILHKHAVKSITGSTVKNSNNFKTLQKLGYEFREVATKGSDVSPIDCWTICNLNIARVDFAIKYLISKYQNVINEYPLIVT